MRPYNAHKLLPHTTTCIFLGYPVHTKGYICQDPLTSRIYISRNVHFNESKFLYPQPLSTGPSADFTSHPTPSLQIPIPLVLSQSTFQSPMPLNAFSPSLSDQSTPPTTLSAQSPSSQFSSHCTPVFALYLICAHHLSLLLLLLCHILHHPILSFPQ